MKRDDHVCESAENIRGRIYVCASDNVCEYQVENPMGKSNCNLYYPKRKERGLKIKKRGEGDEERRS